MNLIVMLGFFSAIVSAQNSNSDLTPFVPPNICAPAVPSMQFRHLKAKQQTITSENQFLQGTAFENIPGGYHAVPQIKTDDDGFSKENVKIVDRSKWTKKNCDGKECKCGLNQKTIAERIQDCQKHPVIGKQSTWIGATNGNSGQVTWKLVARGGDVFGEGVGTIGQEVWQDQHTGFLWSSRVALGVNWCKATGSNFITNNPTAEADPSGYCSHVSYQNTGVGPEVKAASACFEDMEKFFTQNDPEIRNEGKVGLGLKSAPKVAWRLPTADDYSLANIHGIRFVFPDMLHNGNWEWTAMILSSNRSSAWDFSTDYGGMGNDNRRGLNGARCIGR